ncbi:MAG: Stk1 family PASTA domain-containing Ser/Thr kinase [Clostridia bacterium]|nr:Stk1 family PASTA domain-containing Ser/Thr kinase [Clostridia bacterium]
MDRFVGKRLDGRYEIREIIGVGGMAVVYKAYDSIEDRIVAIKILKEEFASNEEFQRRFKNESKAIAVLSHPNIVKVYDVSFGDLIQYIVMEYIEGITLKEYIENNGGLSWNDAVTFTIQILRGLQHAHDKGIVHRDVKPQNIMVLSDKTIKVTDFGIARFARKESQTITDKAIGSVHYISPEQAKGEFTDEKADIYSLGVIMYEMLTGNLPFEAESAVSVAIMQLQTEPKLPTHINPLIPLGLEQITMKAMQKDTQNRYKSAAEMLRDLEQFKRDPSTVFHNSYFVDDSPTKPVDNFYYDTETQSNEEKEPETQNKVSVVAILTGVAVAFIAAIIVLCIIFIPKLMGNSGEKFECPDFFGKNKTQLAEYEEEYGLKFLYEYGTPNPEIAAEIEAGEIYEQKPPAGTMVGADATITVTICSGDLEIVELPNVVGQEASKAQFILVHEGFEVEVVSEHSEEMAEGCVIRTDPAYGSKLAPGSKIKLFVSLGVLKEPKEVPDVTRHSLEEAKRLIEQAGFTVGSVSQVSSEPNFKGYVVNQSPVGGSGKMAEKGTAINLYVGNGVPVYKFNLNVALPSDYVNDHGFISAWIDNAQVSADQYSGKVEISKLKNATFKISTEKAAVQVTIKLSPDNVTYHNYITYTVDATNGSVLNIVEHSYPIKQDNATSTPENSSDTGNLSNGEDEGI